MSNSNIADFGEKIGAARKDLRGNFSVADLSSLTGIERVKLVRKDMVWPTPDYAVLVKEKGYEVKAAAMIKMLRDAFPAAPLVLSSAGDDRFTAACALYVKTLNTARRISESGTSASQLAEVMRSDSDARTYLVQIDAQPNGFNYQAGVTLPGWRAGPASTMVLSYSQYSKLWDAVSCFGSGQLNRLMARTIRKNQSWPEGVTLVDAWIKRANLKPILVPGGRWGVGIGYSSRPFDQMECQFTGAGPSLKKLVGQTYATKEEASEAIIDAVREKYATRRLDAKRAQLELMSRANGQIQPEERNGYRINSPAWRSRAATGEDYLREFRVRGGEFGNWVNQGERQEVLDRGYDALRDLAEMFQWPGESISLNGTLAIAFGSRGQGGAIPAAAHYEPGRRVINLTKPHGEGCLAHEWAHALDHYLGGRAVALGLAKATYSPFLSNLTLDVNTVTKRSDEVAYLCDLRNAMRDLESRPLFPGEEREQCKLTFDAKKDAFKKLWDDRLKLFHAEASSVDGMPPNESGWQHTAIRDRLLLIPLGESDHAALGGPNTIPTGAEIEQGLAESFEEIAKQNAVMGSSFQQHLPWLNSCLQITIHQLERFRRQYAELGRQEEEYKTSPAAYRAKRVPTDYKKSCQELDKKRDKAYYASPHEMFARSFEAVVYDALAALGRKSPYLVSGTGGEAYPAGKERKLWSAKLLGSLKNLSLAGPSITIEEIRGLGQMTDMKREPAEALSAQAHQRLSQKI